MLKIIILFYVKLIKCIIITEQEIKTEKWNEKCISEYQLQWYITQFAYKQVFTIFFCWIEDGYHLFKQCHNLNFSTPPLKIRPYFQP